MKKALIVLLILGVAGGLFAQVTWSGYVNTGIGFAKADDAEDPVFGLMGKDAWTDGMRAHLNVSYINDDGDGGFEGQFRANGNVGSTANNPYELRRAYAWSKSATGLLEFWGGRIDGTYYSGNDGLMGDDWFNSIGLLANISPIDILTIGLGGYAPEALSGGLPWDGDGLTLFLGIAVDAGIVGVHSQFHINKGSIDGYVTASAGLGVVDLGLGVYLWKLNEFGDAGEFNFFAKVGLNVLDGLGLNIGGAFGMSQADGTDPWMAFGAWGDFAIGIIKPALGVLYNSGSSYLPGWGLAYGANWYTGHYADVTYNKNFSYLTINPAVNFGIGPGNLEFGAVLNMDMGEGNAAGSSDKGMSYAVYLDYSFSY